MTENEALDELASCRADVDQVKARLCDTAAHDPTYSTAELFEVADKLQEIAAALEDAEALLR